MDIYALAILMQMILHEMQIALGKRKYVFLT